MTEWRPSRWTTFDENSDKVFIDEIQKIDGCVFAVRNMFGFVLAKTGFFEMEPQPSNRNEAFYERCRFDTLEEAKESYEKWHNRP